MKQRTGGIRWVNGKPYMRIRTGEGRRPNIPLTGVPYTDEDALEKRCELITNIVNKMLAVGRQMDVERTARSLGAAASEYALRVLVKAAELLIKSGPGLARDDDTFAAFAARWTRGDLAREHPDHVSTKDATSDIRILNKYVNPLIGPLPIKAVTIDNCDAVMKSVPAHLSTSRRRHVAQVIHRVLALAVFPAKVIAASPLPKGWLPKLGKGKAKQFLHPEEDRKLLGCTAIPFERRLLWGVLHREGMRIGEAIQLEWENIESRGALNLDENKTDDPRTWALDASVHRAFNWWKDHGALRKGPFARLTTRHAADQYREDLKTAGVDRPALFKRSDKRSPIRAHDTRATFVTLHLAIGKTETWVMDRTGHRSSVMVARYRRMARTAAELNLGPLGPLADLLPECGSNMGQPPSTESNGAESTMTNDIVVGSPSRTRTGTLRRARDFKSEAGSARHRKSRRNRQVKPDSQGLGGVDPHAVTHPTRGPHWRSAMDAFDHFVALAIADEVGES